MDRGTFDDVLRRIEPRLLLRDLAPGGEAFRTPSGFLTFRSLADFEPNHVARRLGIAGKPTVGTAAHAHLTSILDHPRFVALEESWRGLFYLVTRMEACPDRRLVVLDAEREEVAADLAAGPAGMLFRMVCKTPFERPGGVPFTLIVADYRWEPTAAHIDALQGLTALGADAHVPVLTNAGAAFIGLTEWDDLRARQPVEVAVHGEAATRWQALRKQQEGRHVALAFPPVAQSSRASEQPRRLNAAYVVAGMIAQQHERTGWVAGLIGEAPGAIAGAEPESARRAGLLPLSWTANGQPCLAHAAMLHEPVVYGTENASTNARIMAQLPFVLATGRVMQTLRIQARELLRHRRVAELEPPLKAWLQTYVQSVDLPIEERRIRTPLHQATLELREAPGGGHILVSFMRPWLGPDQVMLGMVRVMGRLPREAD